MRSQHASIPPTRTSVFKPNTWCNLYLTSTESGNINGSWAWKSVHFPTLLYVTMIKTYPYDSQFKFAKHKCSATKKSADISMHDVKIWGLWCQKQPSQAGINNCISQYSVGYNYISLPEIPASGTKFLIWERQNTCFVGFFQSHKQSA